MFLRQREQFGISSQRSVRRDRGGAAATKRAEESLSSAHVTLPCLPPGHSFAEMTKLIKYLMQVFLKNRITYKVRIGLCLDQLSRTRDNLCGPEWRQRTTSQNKC